MIVRTSGDEEATFCGQTGEEKDILGGVRGMENLDSLKSCFHEVGEAGQPVWTRVGQDGDAFRIPDGRYGLMSGERAPLHIGWAVPGQETIEGLLQTAHHSLCEQSPGHVESSDRSPPSYPHNLRQGKGYPESVQTADYFFKALVPLSLEGEEGVAESCVIPADKITQDMSILAGLMYRELDAWDELDLEVGTRLECFGNAGHGVVVGEGDWVEAAGSRLGNDLSRRKGPVRVIGVEMEVCSDRDKGIHQMALAVSRSRKSIFAPFLGAIGMQAASHFTIGKTACGRQGKEAPIVAVTHPYGG